MEITYIRDSSYGQEEDQRVCLYERKMYPDLLVNGENLSREEGKLSPMNCVRSRSTCNDHRSNCDKKGSDQNYVNKDGLRNKTEMEKERQYEEKEEKGKENLTQKTKEDNSNSQDSNSSVPTRKLPKVYSRLPKHSPYLGNFHYAPSAGNASRRVFFEGLLLSEEEYNRRKNIRRNPFTGNFHYQPGKYSRLHGLKRFRHQKRFHNSLSELDRLAAFGKVVSEKVRKSGNPTLASTFVNSIFTSTSTVYSRTASAFPLRSGAFLVDMSSSRQTLNANNSNSMSTLSIKSIDNYSSGSQRGREEKIKKGERYNSPQLNGSKKMERDLQTYANEGEEDYVSINSGSSNNSSAPSNAASQNSHSRSREIYDQYTTGPWSLHRYRYGGSIDTLRKFGTSLDDSAITIDPHRHFYVNGLPPYRNILYGWNGFRMYYMETFGVKKLDRGFLNLMNPNRGRSRDKITAGIVTQKKNTENNVNARYRTKRLSNVHVISNTISKAGTSDLLGTYTRSCRNAISNSPARNVNDNNKSNMSNSPQKGIAIHNDYSTLNISAKEEHGHLPVKSRSIHGLSSLSSGSNSSDFNFQFSPEVMEISPNDYKTKDEREQTSSDDLFHQPHTNSYHHNLRNANWLPGTVNAEHEQEKYIFNMPRPIQHPLLERDVVSDYHINYDQILGEGSYAVVYAGMHIESNCQVAIKCIRRSYLFTEDEKLSVKREIENMIRANNHRNLIHLMEVFETPDYVYLITDRCTHGTLEQMLQIRRKLTELETMWVMRQCLEAINYCHNVGVVHCDLKPQNILLTEPEETDIFLKSYHWQNKSQDSKPNNGTPLWMFNSPLGMILKVCDFGLSRKVPDVRFFKYTGDINKVPFSRICGTGPYLPPEIISKKSFGKEADMWSLGIVCYRLLCGSMPFSPPKNCLHLSVTFKGKLWDQISTDGKDFVTKLLQKDPRKRYTAKQALDHPWMRATDGLAPDLTHCL